MENEDTVEKGSLPLSLSKWRGKNLLQIHLKKKTKTRLSCVIFGLVIFGFLHWQTISSLFFLPSTRGRKQRVKTGLETRKRLPWLWWWLVVSLCCFTLFCWRHPQLDTSNGAVSEEWHVMEFCRRENSCHLENLSLTNNTNNTPTTTNPYPSFFCGSWWTSDERPLREESKVCTPYFFVISFIVCVPLGTKGILERLPILHMILSSQIWLVRVSNNL